MTMIISPLGFHERASVPECDYEGDGVCPEIHKVDDLEFEHLDGILLVATALGSGAEVYDCEGDPVIAIETEFCTQGDKGGHKFHVGPCYEYAPGGDVDNFEACPIDDDDAREMFVEINIEPPTEEELAEVYASLGVSGYTLI